MDNRKNKICFFLPSAAPTLSTTTTFCYSQPIGQMDQSLTLTRIIELPLELMKLLLTHWIDFQSLIAFDSALCNQEHRLTILSSLPIRFGVTTLGIRVRQSPILEERFLEWATRRLVVVKELCVFPLVPVDVYERFFNFCGVHVEAIQFMQIKYLESCNRQFIAVANHCQRLTSVSFLDCTIAESIIRLLLNNAPIKSLSIYN